MSLKRKRPPVPVTKGQLDLFYYRDPGIKAGKSFPLLDDYVTLVTLPQVVPEMLKFSLSSHKEPEWILGAELKRVCGWLSAKLV